MSLLVWRVVQRLRALCGGTCIAICNVVVRILLIAFGLVACDDRCANLIDRVGPMLDEYDAADVRDPLTRAPMDRDARIAACKRDLAAHPKRAAWIDCVLAKPGEIAEAIAACGSRAGPLPAR